MEEHLDPDKEGCQHVEVPCPLNCQKTVSKILLAVHMAEECVQRPHVCKYCNFKGTYEKVVDVHLPQCKYVPLTCANRCGVTCERQYMEDHVKTCRREEVACQFVSVGCEDRFLRENEEDHMIQNTQSHLSMMSARLVTVDQRSACRERLQNEEVQKFKDDVEQQMNEKDRRLQEQAETINHLEREMTEQDKQMKEKDQVLQDFKENINHLERLFKDLDQQMKDKDQIMLKMDARFDRLETKSKEQDQTLLQAQTLQAKLRTMEQCMQRRFTLRNYSLEKTKACWDAPPMYTHLCGYKFKVILNPNGAGGVANTAMLATLYAMQGEYDNKLPWPAKATFALELFNFTGGANVRAELTIIWNKPVGATEHMGLLYSTNFNGYLVFMPLSNIGNFLHNDSLQFVLSVH